MGYEELSLTGFVNEMADVSSGPHPRRFCFVLGAGASRTSGIKSGQELVNIWDRELRERNPEEYRRWRQELGITEENKYSFYSQYYEKRYFREPTDGYNYLEKLMEHARPSTGYVMLSYLLTKTSHNVVITTNFDHMVEDAVNYYAQSIPLVVGHEALWGYVREQRSRPTVIKIHRDLLFDPKNRANEVEELHENWKNALDFVFSRYHPVFIGYGGNDNSLMGFLIENSEKFQDRTWRYPYWMLYKSDPLEGKILEFLEKAEGHCIRHDGFDETLYLMGDALGYKMPTKESFLANAEERYHMLANSIDKFTAKRSPKETAPSGSSAGAAAEPVPAPEATPITEAIRRVTGQSEQQKLYNESITLYDTDKFAEAAAIQKKLVRDNPENALYHYSYGRTLSQMGDKLGAVDEMRSAIAQEPEVPLYHWNLGYIMKDIEGRLEEAVAAVQKAIELAPEDGFYHSQLCLILLQMERNEEALAEALTAVELDFDHAFYFDNLGDAYERVGEKERLLSARQRAMELEPKNAWFHFKYSDSLFTQGDQNEALEQIKTAISLDPADEFYHRFLGKVLEAMGRHEEAAQAQKTADELKAASNG